MREARAAIERHHADSALPLVRFGDPIQRALRGMDGLVSMMQPQYINSMSQELEAAYHDCGQYYYGLSRILLESGQMFSDRTVALITPETEVQDIDHEEDWIMAELKYQRMQSTKLGRAH